MQNQNEQKNATQWGVIGAIICYSIWGAFPLYWKALKHVPALEILAHRVVWSAVMMTLLFAQTGRLTTIIKRILIQKKLLFQAFLAAFLIACNWYVYIWAVNNGYILETSLGYFINPFVNFLLGLIVFKERFRRSEWPALILIFGGLFYLTLQFGRPPYLSLLISLTFAGYALFKKISQLSSLDSLWVETILLFFPCALYLIFLESQGQGHFAHQEFWWQEALLIGAGLVTCVPLYLFGLAAQSIPLSLLGLLQYISPTGQFLIGVFIYHEQLQKVQLITFSMIWSGLIYFACERFWQHRQAKFKLKEGGVKS